MVGERTSGVWWRPWVCFSSRGTSLTAKPSLRPPARAVLSTPIPWLWGSAGSTEQSGHSPHSQLLQSNSQREKREDNSTEETNIPVINPKHSSWLIVCERYVSQTTVPPTDPARVDIKPEVPLDPVSPLDLRTDLRMLGSGSDPGVWERQLQQELLLIQKQQHVQKQLLISEFQKQHENLTRQHQAQLQEHLKELQAMKQQQELVEKERRQQQQSQQEKEQERHRREQHVLCLSLRGKERTRESLTGAVASNEVKQKLQEFLLSKSNKDLSTAGATHALIHHPKLWYTSSHHTSLDQSSSPLGGMSPVCHYTHPSPQDGKDDFPLRKTASEPNLKVKSRLKQKVAERRSSPLLKRKDSNVMTPYKKRALEMMDSTATNSAPGSGPSSPVGASSALGAENGPSSLPTTTKTERWPSQPRLFRPEGSMSNLLSLYTSPSLPNITLGLSATSSQISAAIGLKEKTGEVRHGLPGQLLGPVPMPTVTSMETKVSPSHQALLQHLLQKEQMRRQKILSSSGQGSMPAHPHSPLAMKDRPSANSRPKLPKHRPLNRTQSAPLPQSTLAQLVIQQQHQHFLEKQKQYQQQIHINKLLSKSIEQLRQPSSLVNPHLQESEEEEEDNTRRMEDERMDMQEDRMPPGGVIQKHTLSSSSSSGSNGSLGELSSIVEAHHRLGVIKVKEEPIDSEDESLSLSNQSLAAEQSSSLHQVKGQLVIRAMI
ncbi:histone deacetylase 9-B isoform X6 [Coregonus clupeaformis]|uniref:histone deacetylase 9-B isoform X6 n=1 Tax=Coregonus clupeaformis TaxID=59861 RepID=UPI001E1C74FE|nr:histone deacetylase 9-B isoform X6 [Coregonus clupeaformis]